MHREKKIIVEFPSQNEAQMVKQSQSIAYLVFFLLKICTTHTRNVMWDVKLDTIVIMEQEGGVELGTLRERHGKIQEEFYWRRASS